MRLRFVLLFTAGNRCSIVLQNLTMMIFQAVIFSSCLDGTFVALIFVMVILTASKFSYEWLQWWVSLIINSQRWPAEEQQSHCTPNNWKHFNFLILAGTMLFIFPFTFRITLTCLFPLVSGVVLGPPSLFETRWLY